jgi:hypothetical protein
MIPVATAGLNAPPENCAYGKCLRQNSEPDCQTIERVSFSAFGSDIQNHKSKCERAHEFSDQGATGMKLPGRWDWG